MKIKISHTKTQQENKILFSQSLIFDCFINQKTTDDDNYQDVDVEELHYQSFHELITVVEGEQSHEKKKTDFTLSLEEKVYAGMVISNLVTELLLQVLPVAAELLTNLLSESFLWTVPLASVGVGALLGWIIHQCLQPPANRTHLLNDLKIALTDPGPHSFKALVLNGTAFFSASSAALRTVPFINAFVNQVISSAMTQTLTSYALGASATAVVGFFAERCGLRQKSTPQKDYDYQPLERLSA